MPFVDKPTPFSQDFFKKWRRLFFKWVTSLSVTLFSASKREHQVENELQSSGVCIFLWLASTQPNVLFPFLLKNKRRKKRNGVGEGRKSRLRYMGSETHPVILDHWSLLLFICLFLFSKLVQNGGVGNLRGFIVCVYVCVRVCVTEAKKMKGNSKKDSREI